MPSSTQRNGVTAGVLQYPHTRNTRCGNEQLGTLLPFHSTYSNSTHLSRPRTSMKPSLGILVYSFIYFAAPCFNPSSEKTAHSHLHFLTEHSGLKSELPLSSKCSKVSNLGSNPWPFPNSSSLQCLTPWTSLPSWHTCLPCTSKYCTRFPNFLTIPSVRYSIFLSQVLSGGVFQVCSMPLISPSSLPHGFKHRL